MAKKKKKSGIDMKDIEGKLKNVFKKHGKDKVGLVRACDLQYNYIPTTIDVLDSAIGGGFLYGSTVLLYGPYSSGKTTLAMRAVGSAQKQGKTCLWVSAEPFNAGWAEKNGVDLDNLLMIRGETLETNADVLPPLINDKSIDIIVYDSIGAVSPKGEKYEKDGSFREIGNDTIGMLARQLSKLNRIIATDVIRNDVSVIFISQVRTNINITGRSSQKAQGGNSVYHSASLILKIKDNKFDGVSDDDGLVFWPVNIRIDKNHITGVERKELTIYNKRNVGPDNELTTLEYAKNKGIITLAGSYYSFGDFKAQGWNSFVETAVEERDIYDAIIEKIDEEIKHEG